MRMDGLNLETVCFLITRARQIDVMDLTAEEAADGSNPSDDNFMVALTEDAGDASEAEVAAVIDGLDVDEQVRLVALAWVGRGDFGADEWGAAVRLAAERRGSGPTARYLLGMPLLGDYLAEGLAAFGLSCVGEDGDGAPGTRRQDPGEGMPIRRRGGTGNDPAG
jgi:hypothetical protein